MLRLSLVATLLCAALGAGCLGEEVSSSLHGSFTAERTDADMQEFNALVSAKGGSAILAESFPEQFTVYGLTPESCAALRTELDAKNYIGSLNECATTTLVDA